LSPGFGPNRRKAKVVDELKALLHSLVDAMIGRYKTSGVEADLRRQIEELRDLVVADVVDDVEKVTKNG